MQVGDDRHAVLLDAVVLVAGLTHQAAGAVVCTAKGENVFPVELDAYDGRELDVIATNKKNREELLGMLGS